MKFTESFEFETTFGERRIKHEARVTYIVHPTEPPEVGGMAFEINQSGVWHEASDDLHDVLMNVIGDDHIVRRSRDETEGELTKLFSLIARGKE